jgi:cyclophilin family peptidyl-prolyl cis-trans isomerase
MKHPMRRLLALLIPAFMAGPVMASDQPAAAPAFDPTDPANIWYLDLSTGGRVKILLRPDRAPNHVERIRALTREGFYNGLLFHRVIEGFMAQAGDPTATGSGGSSLPDLKAEFNALPHMRGAVSMARTSDPDSANSQFFITFEPMLRLDRNYTVFGRVLEGMEWVDAIERGEPPANPSRILQASIAADNVPPPAFPPPRQPDQGRALIDAEAAKLFGNQPPQ